MAEEKSIENYLAEIRRINEELSQENVRMDDALRLYKRGVGLVREAEQLLGAYQQQVEMFEAAGQA